MFRRRSLFANVKKFTMAGCQYRLKPIKAVCLLQYVRLQRQHRLTDDIATDQCGAMQKAARHSIPRGFCPTYSPCLDEECQDLLKQYEESGDPDIADHLVKSLDAARRHRWEELTAKMNFTNSSRKSWALIRRLGAAQQPPKSSHPSVSANAVAAYFIQVAKAPHDRSSNARFVCRAELFCSRYQTRVFLIHSRKPATAPSYDNIHSEFLKNWAPKLAPGCPNSSPESWLPIPSRRSGERPRR